MDGLRKDDKTTTKGVLGAIKEGEKMDVFLARGCGELQVELCAGVYGKELFHSIKRAGLHAKHNLNLIRWPVLITNRLALAVAGFWWGGEDSHTLIASDCASAKPEQIESWKPPAEHKIEARVKPPPSFLTWLRYAENSVRVFGSAYGLEHVPERMEFLRALRDANEEDENAYPTAYCAKLFEELTAVWNEEVREQRRQLCALLDGQKLVALVPDPMATPTFSFQRSGPSKTLADTTRAYSKEPGTPIVPHRLLVASDVP